MDLELMQGKSKNISSSIYKQDKLKLNLFGFELPLIKQFLNSFFSALEKLEYGAGIYSFQFESN